MFNNYRHRAPPPPAQAAAGVVQGLGHMPPAARTAVPKSDFQKIKKDPRGRRWCPPSRHTKFQDFIYNIVLCPRGRRGPPPGSILEGAPGSPKPSCLFSHFISQTHRTTGTHCHCRHCCRPPCSPGSWQSHPCVHGAPSPQPHQPSVVVGFLLLLLRLTKPLEEGCD